MPLAEQLQTPTVYIPHQALPPDPFAAEAAAVVQYEIDYAARVRESFMAQLAQRRAGRALTPILDIRFDPPEDPPSEYLGFAHGPVIRRPASVPHGEQAAPATEPIAGSEQEMATKGLWQSLLRRFSNWRERQAAKALGFMGS